MLALLIVSLIVIACLTVVFCLSFDTFMNEIQQGDYAEAVVSLVVLCMYAILVYFVVGAVKASWVLGGF